VRNGTAARESAAQIFVRAPRVMGEILDSKEMSPRHRIEAARELRAAATPENANSPTAGDRFTIVIDLGGGHVEKFHAVTPESKTIEDEPMPKLERPKRGRPPLYVVTPQPIRSLMPN
jgi:hypothetical protein